MKRINAKGKPCPEPVTMTKACIDQGETELEILLDNPVSASNVMRFLEGKGFGVQLKDDEGMLTISATKKEGDHALTKPSAFKKTPEEVASVKQPPVAAAQSESAPVPDVGHGETFSVLITGDRLGQSDRQLGEILMKSFLGTLSQLDDAPVAVALMNEGVKLALFDSSACDHLKNLEKKGVSIFVCGTCVNHFQIGDQIGVGIISNMFEIVEGMNKASKMMTL